VTSVRPTCRPPSEARRLNKRLLAAGALATAVSAVIAAGGTLHSWVSRPSPKVLSLDIARITPLTYGEWLDHEHQPRKDFPAEQMAAPGKLINYDVSTDSLSPDDQVTVRVILHDATHDRSHEFGGGKIRGGGGDTCGCADWIPVPRDGDTYYLEVALYAPGEPEGQPVRRRVSGYFKGSLSV